MYLNQLENNFEGENKEQESNVNYLNEIDNGNDNSDYALLLEQEIPHKFLKSKREKTNTNINKTNSDNNGIVALCDKSHQLKLRTKELNCEICKQALFKYTCPACNLKTCSLQCVNTHKKIKRCSGKKPKFKKQLESNEDLMKDVKFLSNMINKTNCISKQVYNNLYEKDNYIQTLNENETNNNESNNNNEELVNTELEVKKSKDKKLKNLIKLCRKFRNVIYERCPMHLSRFNENNSYCDSKSKKFFWTVRLYFLNINLSANTISNTNSNNNNSTYIPSHIFPTPFDDSVSSLNSILEYLINNKNEISDVEVLSSLSEVKSVESINNYSFYYRISKIDYENFILMNTGKEIDMRKNNSSNDLKVNLKEDHVMKYNEFFFFRKLKEENYDKLLIDVIKNTSVRDYLEYYVSINN